MGEMFEHGSVGREEVFEHGFAIMLGAAPEDMVMGAGDDLDCVKLDKAELFDDAENIGRTRRRTRERLCIEPEMTGIAIGDA